MFPPPSWLGPTERLDKSRLVDLETGTEFDGVTRSYAFTMDGNARQFEWRLGPKGKNKLERL